LETAILKAHLTLELGELEDDTKKLLFKEATDLAAEGFTLLERQFKVLQSTISILGRLATVKSLTSKRASPILLFVAILPFANAWLNKFKEPRESRRHSRTFPLFTWS
jgi:hypothetical protein